MGKETIETLSSSLDILWQWSYEIELDKLQRLYKMGKRDQWNADVELNWDQPIDPAEDILDETRVPFKTTKFWRGLSKTQRQTFSANNASYMLSQFLHGEQGALMVSAALVHAVPDYEAKLYAATQAMDEARHVEVFDRYIKKFGKIYPIDNFLKTVIDKTLTQPSWVGMLVGMQIIVEGLALGSFINMAKATTEPLFRELLQYVARDESRHVAFGNLYVKQIIEDLDPDERESVEDFAFEALQLMRQARLNRGGASQSRVYEQVMIDSQIDPKDFLAAMVREYAEGWRPIALPGQVHTFKDVMMPQLVRVGLVSSERIRRRYEEAQVSMFDDFSILQSIEVDITSELATN